MQPKQIIDRWKIIFMCHLNNLPVVGFLMS